MENNQNEKKLESLKKNVDLEINNFIKDTDLENNEEVKRSINYLKWLEKKSQIIHNEKSFEFPQNFKLNRGTVVWVEFGFNIGREFGGRHPALILRKTGDSIFVVPLSSQEPEEIKDYHVKINKVYGFKNMVRWTNVLKIINISIQRVDFTSSVGNVKGYVLNKINDAIEKNRIK